MDKFVVTGIPAFNGEYPLAFDRPFTMRELNIIKRMSGVRAGELPEAFAAGDSDVMVALAVIAVRRAGKHWEAFEQLAWESEAGAITYEGKEAAEPATPLTSAKPESSADPPMPSGLPSQTDGARTQEKNLRAIGSQG